MRMLSASIYMQAASLLAADNGVRNHSVDCNFHCLFRMGFHQGCVLYLFQMADPSGVPTQIFLLQLFAGQNSFRAVDDDDVVTTVNVGSKGGVMFAKEKGG